MNSAPIKPPNFNEIGATIFGPPQQPQQDQEFTPRPAMPRWDNPAPASDNSGPRIDALTREIIINRELIRRQFNLTKGQLHEQIETIKEDLFTPRQANNMEAVLQTVQAMLNEQRNEIETLLTAHSIRNRPIPAEQPRPTAQAQAVPAPQEEEVEEAGEEDPPAAFYGRLDVPDKPSIEPVPRARDMGMEEEEEEEEDPPMRRRRKSVPPKAQ